MVFCFIENCIGYVTGENKTTSRYSYIYYEIDNTIHFTFFFIPMNIGLYIVSALIRVNTKICPKNNIMVVHGWCTTK